MLSENAEHDVLMANAERRAAGMVVESFIVMMNEMMLGAARAGGMRGTMIGIGTMAAIAAAEMINYSTRKHTEKKKTIFDDVAMAFWREILTRGNDLAGAS